MREKELQWTSHSFEAALAERVAQARIFQFFNSAILQSIGNLRLACAELVVILEMLRQMGQTHMHTLTWHWSGPASQAQHLLDRAERAALPVPSASSFRSPLAPTAASPRSGACQLVGPVGRASISCKPDCDAPLQRCIKCKI